MTFNEQMPLGEVMRFSGCVGAAVASPLERPFIGSPEALLLRPSRAHRNRGREQLRGARLLNGSRMQKGWLGVQVLRCLAISSSLSRDVAERIGVAQLQVEACMSYLLRKMMVRWGATEHRRKPRLWSITQAGRDWLEAQSK